MGLLSRLLNTRGGDDRLEALLETRVLPQAPAPQEEILTNRLAQAYREIFGLTRLNNDYCHQLTALNRAHQKSLAIIRALRKQRKSEQVETRERLGNQIVDALTKLRDGADSGSRNEEYRHGLTEAIRVVNRVSGLEYDGDDDYEHKPRATTNTQEVPIGLQEFKADKFFVQFEGESVVEAIKNHFNGGFDDMESAIAEAALDGTEPYKIVDRWGQVLATGGK